MEQPIPEQQLQIEECARYFESSASIPATPVATDRKAMDAAAKRCGSAAFEWMDIVDWYLGLGRRDLYRCGLQKSCPSQQGPASIVRILQSWAIYLESLELPHNCALLVDLIPGCCRPNPRRFHQLDDCGPESMACLAQHVGNCPSGHALVTNDFFVMMVSTFRLTYVFALMEVGTSRLPQYIVTAHPLQFVLHDQDSFLSWELGTAVTLLGVSVLLMPVRAPKANTYCGRLRRSLRRECLDFLIPHNQGHLRPTSQSLGN